MEIFSLLLVVLALCLFEMVNSIDNAIIDADILNGVKKKSRRVFMVFDILFAVLIVRGLLPWVIVFLTVPSLGFFGAFSASFSEDPLVVNSIAETAPLLLVGAGVFFVLLFLDWIFRKPKHFAHFHERILHGRDELFHIFALILLALMLFVSLALAPNYILPIFIGFTVFFVLHGLKSQFNLHKSSIVSGEKKNISDFKKLTYLEIIDSVFSIDSVLGAFAFTFSVPIIIIGAGLGAVVVRVITLKNTEHLKKYSYLRNGAMYSVFFLGIIMIFEAFDFDFPLWFSPLVTMLIIFYFIHKSHKEAKLLHDLGVPIYKKS